MKTHKQYIVIDDDPLNNLVCNYIILRFDPDAEITLFTNAEKALAVVGIPGDGADHGITVLFLDINMPVMSGWEFLEAFANFDEKIHKLFKIYILSSSIDQGDIEKAAASPFVEGHYPKPLSVKTLGLISEFE